MTDVEQVTAERDALNRELVGVTEMLAQVLAVVDEPVVVTKQSLKGGLPGQAINIDQDEESFIFSLVPRNE